MQIPKDLELLVIIHDMEHNVTRARLVEFCKDFMSKDEVLRIIEKYFDLGLLDASWECIDNNWTRVFYISPEAVDTVLHLKNKLQSRSYISYGTVLKLDDGIETVKVLYKDGVEVVLTGDDLLKPPYVYKTNPEHWLPFCHKDKGNGNCAGAFPDINDYHPKCTGCIWFEPNGSKD